MKKFCYGLLLFTIACYFLFFHLGSYGLLETTDARYAEIAWEMVKTHDFFIPHLNFIKHFHKPPFTYWITALGYKILGENEWGARFFLGVFGLFTIIIVFLLARICFDEKVGTFSSLILISMLGFFAVTHVVSTDLYLLFFITLAMYCFLRWERFGHSLLWGWAVLGVSALVKGPVGPILVGVTCLLYLALTRQLQRLRNAQIGKGIILFCLIALPWYGWVCVHHKGLITYFVKAQFFSRIGSEGMGHPHPWYYYFPLLPALTFPWTFYLLPSFIQAIYNLNKEKFFFLLWAIVPFILFSLMKTKLPFYILPCLPPLAILGGKWWSEVFSNPSNSSKIILIFMIIICFILTLGALVMALSLYRGTGNVIEWQQLKSLWWGEVFVLGGITILFLIAKYLKHHSLHFIAVLALSNAFFHPLLWYGDKLPINTYKSLGKVIYCLAKPADIIVQYKTYLRSLPFYVKRPTVLVDITRETQFEDNENYKKLLIDHQTFWQWWEENRRIFCLISKKHLCEFIGKKYFVVGQRRKYVVITNKPLAMKEVNGFSWAGCQTLFTPGFYLKPGGI